jgi:hypothetical protein
MSVAWSNALALPRLNGPNWRGAGLVEVHTDAAWAGVPVGAALVVDFDHRSVASGGRFLVCLDGVPELLQFKRSPRGLRARVGGQWVDVTDDDQRDMRVVGRLVEINK